MIADRLERLVEEMVDKGVRFDDAVREFERRFIVRMLGKEDGSLTRTGPPMRSVCTATRSLARWASTRSNAGRDETLLTNSYLPAGTRGRRASSCLDFVSPLDLRDCSTHLTYRSISTPRLTLPIERI